MTDTPPKPKRRRWRWLVVGMLLFVVSVAGWWYWPRPDPRFVGSWSVVGDGKLPSLTIVLRPSGIAETHTPDPSGRLELVGHWRWSVRDEVLIKRVIRQNRLDGIKDFLLTTFAHLQGQKGLFDRPYGRLSPGIDSLVITHPNGQSQTLRRLPK